MPELWPWRSASEKLDLAHVSRDFRAKTRGWHPARRIALHAVMRLHHLHGTKPGPRISAALLSQPEPGVFTPVE